MKPLSFKSSSSSQNRQKGVARPLFERLQLESFPPLDQEGLRSSIAREIRLILNTRPTYKHNTSRNRFKEKREENVEELLPTHFGLRDFSLQQANSQAGRRVLIQEIKKIIERFEPRLENIHVHLSFLEQHKLSLSLEISGDIEWNLIKSRTIFPIMIKNIFVDKSGYAS